MAIENEATVWGPGMIPEPGPPGDQGPPGPTPNFTIGTVAQGLTAAVTLTGTALNPVLNFVLPQGNPGNPGNPGQPANIAIGTVTTLPVGSPATATMGGTYPNLLLNLGLPTGATGAGSPGTPGSVIYSGNGPPTNAIGTNGDYYVDALNKDWWGPKGATWAGTPTFSMVPAVGLPRRAFLTRATDQAVGAWPAFVSFSAAQLLNVTGVWSAGQPTRIVVPSGVSYATILVQIEVNGGATAGTLIAEVYKNGVALSPRSFNNSGRNTTSGSAINVLTEATYQIPVVAGDYFEIRADQSNLTATAIVGSTLWTQVSFS